MDLMNIVRIAKVVALLAFALPWVAVSCQNVDVATASGIELMQGKMTANPDFEKQLGQRMGGFGGLEKNTGGGVDASASTSDLGINFFAIAAAIVILGGLGLTFAGKGKTAGRNALVSSLLGLALVFGTVWWWKDSASRDMREQQGGRAETSSPFGNAGGSPFGGGNMDAMGAQMLGNMLQERFGYWIALIALGVAAGAGGLVMVGGVPSAKPEGTP
jgi:hypothetical protein